MTTTTTHHCTDPRPYRQDGPYDNWLSSTTRPTCKGQSFYTFGTTTQTSMTATVLEIEGDEIHAKVSGSSHEFSVKAAFAAVVRSEEHTSELQSR